MWKLASMKINLKIFSKREGEQIIFSLNKTKVISADLLDLIFIQIQLFKTFNNFVTFQFW